MIESPTEHSECAVYLKEMGQRLACDVIVSVEPPLVVGPYTTSPFICPHGTRFWVKPSCEQIAEWVRDGVE